MHCAKYLIAASLWATVCPPQTAPASLESARSLYEQGRISESISILKRAELASPHNSAVDSLLALDYCAIDDDKNARVHLDRVVRGKATQSTVAALAPCFLQAGDPGDALLAYEYLRKTAPSDDAYVGAARALIALSKEAMAKLAAMPGNESYSQAVDAARNGQPSAPDVALPEAYKRAPYLKPEDSLDRIAGLRRAHASEPAFEYILGVRTGQAAIAAVAECDRRFPDSVSLLRFEAEALVAQGQVQEAIQRLRQAASVATASPEVFRDLGLTYYKMKDFANALSEFKRFLAAAPNSEEARLAVSRCLIQLGYLEEDTKLIKPLVNLTHPPEWALLDWAIIQTSQGHTAEAIRALKQLEALEPADASIHYRLARLYAVAGDKAASEREFAIFRRFPSESETVKAEH